MKNKIYKVSIAIPAFNEENNIVNILSDILSQKQDSWNLLEILVYCDGSTDKTPDLVRKFQRHKNLVKIINDKQNKGKIFRVNQMLHDFKGDILTIFDADVRISTDQAINLIIDQFNYSNDVMLVAGEVKVFPPKTFFQKAIYTAYEVHYKTRDDLKDGHNIHGVAGACLSMRKKFARSFTIPDCITEDTYIYFSCLKKGWIFRHAKGALVQHHMATNLKDYFRQIFRTHPEAVNIMQTQYFGDLVKQEYFRPKSYYFKNVLLVFIKNPVGTISAITIKLVSKPLFPIISIRYQQKWFTAVSTKYA